MPIRRHHSLPSPVEVKRVAEEFRTALLEPWYSLPYGAKREAPQLVQLAKDLQHGNAKAPLHVCEILLGSRSLGASVTGISRPLDTLKTMFVAREPATALESIEDLQELETRVESLLNPIQMAVARGDHSFATLKKMLDYIDESIAILQRLRQRVAELLYGNLQ